MKILMCLQCGVNERHSRGLCTTCYKMYQRAGELDSWPTKPFMDDPESYIRWAFGYYPDLIEEIAVEFNGRIEWAK